MEPFRVSKPERRQRLAGKQVSRKRLKFTQADWQTGIPACRGW